MFRYVGPRVVVPLQETVRAITPDTFTPAPRTALMDDVFEQISRAFKDGATELDALTLVLRLLSNPFDGVDTGWETHEVACFWCF